MTRYVIAAVLGGIASASMGFDFWFGTAAGLILSLLLNPRPAQHRVMVEDVTTGKIKIQPYDSSTRRYLRSRNKGHHD